MHRSLTKRLALLSLVFGGFVICALVLMGVFARPKVQTLVLAGGTKVHFLGVTDAKNDWNPTTHFLIPRFYSVPLLRPLIRHFPKPAISQPGRLIIEEGSAFWFFVEKDSSFRQKIVFRCLDRNGEQVIGFENLDSSRTNATPIWLPSVKADEAARIHTIEIHLRDWPLSSEIDSVLNSIPGINLPGTRVGDFMVRNEHSRSD